LQISLGGNEMNKPDLVLLHGALGAQEQFAPLLPLLEPHFRLHTLDFEGHGHAPMSGEPFALDRFVQSVCELLDAEGISDANLFGYSKGGYVGCALALAHPDRVRRLATLGTKYGWTQEDAQRETGFLVPSKMAEKIPQFVELLRERHVASGWEAVVERSAEFMWALADSGGITAERVSGLEMPVRVMVGDRDRTASVPESMELARALPKGELEVLPATPHPFERVPLQRLATSLHEFFAQP
jgi:pimeloyl-ACP methyl ester carboxylesterase